MSQDFTCIKAVFGCVQCQVWFPEDYKKCQSSKSDSKRIQYCDETCQYCDPEDSICKKHNQVIEPYQECIDTTQDKHKKWISG